MAARIVSRELELSLDDRELRYHFHRVPRRRHVHLFIDDDAVLHVRAPYRCSAGEAERLVRESQGWVLRKLDTAADRVARRPRLRSGAKLPFLDDELVLNVNPVQQIDLFDATDIVDADEVVRCRNELRVRVCSSNENDLRTLLQLWYRRQADHVLRLRARSLARLIGLSPKRVSVRAQKTCWGSCSAHGNINLNWRLMLLPEQLAEYVIVHELCHLRHLDHSSAFWRLVGTLVPDYKLRRRALHRAQSELPL